MTTTTRQPERSLSPIPPPKRRALGGLSRALFLAAVAVIALHVIDDSFVQPQPGTSAGDHLFSGLIPLAILALAAWAYPRVRTGARAAIAPNREIAAELFVSLKTVESHMRNLFRKLDVSSRVEVARVVERSEDARRVGTGG